MKEYLLSDGTSAALAVIPWGRGLANRLYQTYNNFDASLFAKPLYAIQDGQPSGPTCRKPAASTAFCHPIPTTCDGYQYQQRDQKAAAWRRD